MFTIGTIYRFPKEHHADNKIVDNLPNFFYETQNDFSIGFDFQRGIHRTRAVETVYGEKRYPVIIISSTPRKAGSIDTPWKDKYDPDHGLVIYYGDSKSIDCKPEKCAGNAILLELFKYFNCDSSKDRLDKCIPVVFFEKVTVDGRPKGNAIFQGFGILSATELVTQYNSDHSYFANYRFTFTVLSLSHENEKFDWQWITDRCNPVLSNRESMKNAPQSWKRFIREGSESIHLFSRNISGRNLVKKNNQLSGNPALLAKIYEYYSKDNKKHDFEYLAMEVTLKVIEKSGSKCKPGWITKQSSDGGVDFVLRLDVGEEDLSSVKIIVLGQAKCEKIDIPTNGVHIARTVARLKRGWIGAYVTTSFFSENVQREVNEDNYPILLIKGSKITEIVERELFLNKMDLNEYLDSLYIKYNRSMDLPESIIDY